MMSSGRSNAFVLPDFLMDDLAGRHSSSKGGGSSRLSTLTEANKASSPLPSLCRCAQPFPSSPRLTHSRLQQVLTVMPCLPLRTAQENLPPNLLPSGKRVQRIKRAKKVVASNAAAVPSTARAVAQPSAAATAPQGLVAPETGLVAMTAAAKSELQPAEQLDLMLPQRKQARLGECELRAMSRCGEMEHNTRQRKVVSPPLQKMREAHALYRTRQQSSGLAPSGLKAGCTAAELECLADMDAHHIDG